MVGIGQLATSRTRPSSLKAHRSSMDPPPRARTMRSIPEKETARRKASLNPAGASLPCTGELNRKTEPFHSRRFKILRKSCKAAPLADDMIATRRAKVGKVFLRASSKRPSLRSFSLSRSNCKRMFPMPSCIMCLTRSWYSPRGSYRVSSPNARHSSPSCGAYPSELASPLKSTALSWLWLSLRTKYRCPLG